MFPNPVLVSFSVGWFRVRVWWRQNDQELQKTCRHPGPAGLESDTPGIHFEHCGRNTRLNLRMDIRGAVDAAVPTNVIAAKAAEVRANTVNWQSYLQGQMISGEDCEFIKRFELARAEEKQAILTTEGHQCAKTFLNLMAHISKEQTVQYILTLIDDTLQQVRIGQLHTGAGSPMDQPGEREVEQEDGDSTTGGKLDEGKEIDSLCSTAETLPPNQDVFCNSLIQSGHGVHCHPVRLFLHILQHWDSATLGNVCCPATLIEGATAMLPFTAAENHQRVNIFFDYAKKSKNTAWSHFLSMLNRQDMFTVHMRDPSALAGHLTLINPMRQRSECWAVRLRGQRCGERGAARIIAKLAAWGRELMEGSDLNYYFNWIKTQLSSQREGEKERERERESEKLRAAGPETASVSHSEVSTWHRLAASSVQPPQTLEASLQNSPSEIVTLFLLLALRLLSLVDYSESLLPDSVISSSQYVQCVAGCLQLMLRIHEYRFAWVEADGVNCITAVLSSKCGFQLQYQMIFCIWLLAFSPQLCESLRRYNVVPALSDILQESVKEKVTRIILAAFRVAQLESCSSLQSALQRRAGACLCSETGKVIVMTGAGAGNHPDHLELFSAASGVLGGYRTAVVSHLSAGGPQCALSVKNLLEKSAERETKQEYALAMIQCKVLKQLENLEQQKYDDEDISDDISFLLERLGESVQDLSSFDEYSSELKSGRLEWSPVHKSEKFWRENAVRLNEKNYELLKILTKLLEVSDDPQVIAVAAHDVGEYVRHYPRGKSTHMTLPNLMMVDEREGERERWTEPEDRGQ
ncbi:hypothetical protein JZ751_000050 [Albula glossodonta]|uniref:ATPase V1 complex subunit H C-terminal domain-containing protein n=1 Tax=Albula glossodonta TaxID=121402 RepID=A0A8T2PUQ6_9TELE|nr:hypothetical protein JZ751_000050 [Albula glossodonta]